MGGEYGRYGISALPPLAVVRQALNEKKKPSARWTRRTDEVKLGEIEVKLGKIEGNPGESRGNGEKAAVRRS